MRPFFLVFLFRPSHNQSGSSFAVASQSNLAVHGAACARMLAVFACSWLLDLESIMSDAIEDKRHDPRVPLIAAVEVTEVATGARLSARTSDLSRSGCYIDTLNPTRSKTVVRVRLTHD